MKKITIYTDGSCLGNPGIGAWAAILIYEDSNKEVHKKIIKGSNPETTNNRMEVQALIEGLKAIKTPCFVDVYSDSKYLCNAINLWMKNWQKNNWKKASGGTVENVDLWKELNKQILTQQRVDISHVKAHRDNEINNQVDDIARNCAEELKKSLSQSN